MFNEEVIDYLLYHLRSQHQYRLEDDCSAGEIKESFERLLNNICEGLMERGVKEYAILSKIQNYN